MATKKFYENYEHIVTPTSKNVVLEYKGDYSVYFGITVDISGKNATKYYSNYENVSVRSGDDLIVKTIFISNSGSAKTVTTTVKDYFTNPNFDNNFTLESNLLKNQTYIITQNTSGGTNGLYSEKGDFDSSDFILASKYDNEQPFNLKKSHDDFVYDEKGKDNYVIASPSGRDYFLEMSGNDKYSASDGSNPHIQDLKGNDEYVAENTNTRMSIEDYSGNDKYEAKDFATIIANDYKGNDEYIAQDNGFLGIEDYKGNDKYWFGSHSASSVFDAAGNDSYDLLNAVIDAPAKLYIIDDKGNDKFNIKKSSNIQIIDGSGADKYEILNGSNAVSLQDYSGNDGYTVSGGSNNLELTDAAGNDKYTLNDCNYVEISDTKGSDSYKLIGTETNKVMNTTITDELGNDKYVLEHINPERKGDSNNKSSILDQNGNDSYSIKETWDLDVIDELGNDKYTLTGKNINLEIYDDSGKDSYISKGTTKLTCAYIVDNGADTDIYNLNGFNTGSISDYGGNNKYTVSSSVDLDIYSYGYGNDTYNIKNIEYFSIEDAFGNDKYTITTSLSGDIIDSQGADKYTVKGAYDKKTKVTTYVTDFKIEDRSGENDTYNFDRVMGKLGFDKNNLENQTYHIKDENGNEKYNIKNSSMIKIQDKGGNDSYTFTDMVSVNEDCSYIVDANGDDKYNVKNGYDLHTYDNDGNDKYTYNNVSNLNIEDKNSTYSSDEILDINTYSIKNSTYAYIYTEDSTDTYKFVNSKEITIEDTGYSNDIYSFTGSKTDAVNVTDFGGDDKYTIDKLKYTGYEYGQYHISDYNSGTDSLTISGLSSKNVMYLGDFDKEGDATGALIILDTKNKGYVQIDKFFSMGGGQYDEFDEGMIETIKAGTKTLKIDEQEMVSYLNSISNAVASWLSSNSYDDICEFLNEGSKEDIANFVAYMTES